MGHITANLGLLDAQFKFDLYQFAKANTSPAPLYQPLPTREDDFVGEAVLRDYPSHTPILCLAF